jgi:hypothetical protein
MLAARIPLETAPIDGERDEIGRGREAKSSASRPTI